MTSTWMDALALVGAQHLWLSAVFLLLAGLVGTSHRLGAAARSKMLLCLLALAAVAPLAVFLPSSDGGAEPAVVAPGADAHVHGMIDVAPQSTIRTAVGLVSTAASSLGRSRPTLLAFAVAAWLLGFAWSLHRLLLGLHEAERLRDTASEAPALERLLASEGPGNAAIRISDQIAGPMVVGMRRPCILVPRDLAAELPDAMVLDLLRHEMAHIRRRDLWITFVQRLCQAFYWWSPLFRLIGARLNLAREMACDAAAASRSGGRSYAQALLASAERLAPSRPLVAVGMLDTRRGLSQRIDALLYMDGAAQAPGVGVGLALGALTAASVVLALTATPRVHHSGDADERAMNSAHVEVLLEAAKVGHVDEVRRLIGDGLCVNARLEGDRPSGTALIQAAKSGNLSMVDELLRLGADVDRASLRDGNPLIMAAMNGHLDVVQRLVTAGADVNAIVMFDETPLINAAREGHLAIVDYLVAHGADVNLGVLADEDRWRTPLNQARGVPVRDYLIGKGAKVGL